MGPSQFAGGSLGHKPSRRGQIGRPIHLYVPIWPIQEGELQGGNTLEWGNSKKWNSTASSALSIFDLSEHFACSVCIYVRLSVCLSGSRSGSDCQSVRPQSVRPFICLLFF